MRATPHRCKTWHDAGICAGRIEKRVMPSRCDCCERPLRSNRKTIAEAPGTVAHWGNGRCQSCHRREARR